MHRLLLDGYKKEIGYRKEGKKRFDL